MLENYGQLSYNRWSLGSKAGDTFAAVSESAASFWLLPLSLVKKYNITRPNKDNNNQSRHGLLFLVLPLIVPLRVFVGGYKIYVCPINLKPSHC